MSRKWIIKKAVLIPLFVVVMKCLLATPYERCGHKWVGPEAGNEFGISVEIEKCHASPVVIYIEKYLKSHMYGIYPLTSYSYSVNCTQATAEVLIVYIITVGVLIMADKIKRKGTEQPIRELADDVQLNDDTIC